MIDTLRPRVDQTRITPSREPAITPCSDSATALTMSGVGRLAKTISADDATSAADFAGVARCLARDPKDRYGDAGELREALTELLLAAGIERTAEELAAFFRDPDG